MSDFLEGKDVQRYDLSGDQAGLTETELSVVGKGVVKGSPDGRGRPLVRFGREPLMGAGRGVLTDGPPGYGLPPGVKLSSAG